MLFPSLPQFLLPLLIEKVDSEILSAKLDSLQTLVSVSPCRIQLSLHRLVVLKDTFVDSWRSGHVPHGPGLRLVLFV